MVVQVHLHTFREQIEALLQTFGGKMVAADHTQICIWNAVHIKGFCHSLIARHLGERKFNFSYAGLFDAVHLAVFGQTLNDWSGVIAPQDQTIVYLVVRLHMSGIGQQLETQIDQHNGVSDHVFTQIQQLLHVIVLNEGDMHVLMPLPHIGEQALHGVENLGQTDGAVFQHHKPASLEALIQTGQPPVDT